MLGRTLRRVSAAVDLLRPSTLVRTFAKVDQLGDATRDLATAVEGLRLRTEQLIEIHRRDAEQRAHLEQLSSILDPEGIERHVIAAVVAAPLHTDPFPHLVVEGWLPRKVYNCFIRGLPPAIFFADREDRRHRLPVPLPLAPAYSVQVWRFMADQIVGRMLHRALSDRFGGVVRDYVRSFCPSLPEDEEFTLHPSDGRILLTHPGYVITPHRDPKWGFVTSLAYLARNGDNEAYGTQLYRVQGDDEAPSGRPFYIDERRCELVKTVPFRPNTLLAFLNSRGAHGASIPADAQPPTLKRHVYQFRLGPDNHTIARLLALMPEERRRLWIGTKSDKARHQAS